MNYYESKDLDRFGEIGQFRGELAEKFFVSRLFVTRVFAGP